MNDQKTKLAVRVVGDHFGDVVQNIAKVLTEGDHCTLPYIFRSVNANLAAQNNGGAAMLASGNSKISSIDGATVRQALMILHQHNCLHIDVPRASEYDTSQQKAVQTGFNYSLNVNNIVHRLQFSRLLAMVRSKFGELAVLVMEAVILHGKVRLDQIQDVVALVQEQDSKKEGPAFTAYEIKAAFETLVSNRFLVTVPFTNATKIAVNTEVVEDTKKASNKRTFDLMAGIAPTAAAPANKRGAGTNKTATAPSNRRAAGANKLMVKEETDDGIPVELRMLMMGAEAAAGSGVGNPANSSTSTGGSGAVKRGAAGAGRMEEDAEWVDDSFTAAPAKAGRGAGRGAGGRNAGGSGRGAAGGRLVGAGRGTAAAAAAAAASSAAALTSGADISSLVKAEVELSDSASNSSSTSSGDMAAAVPLWMVGWDQFLRETRHEACVQVVTLLHESMSGSVVRIMLALSMGAEMGANQNKSGEVNVADIFAQLDREYHAENAAAGKAGGSAGVKKKPAVRLDLISLKRLLEYLRLSESGAVIKVVGSETEIGGPSYMVNIDGLINTLQRRTVFSVASERFGFVSARIVELLQRHRYLEQQQVCDMALLPARETRERLYKLFLDKWVNYIDLSKRSDFNPSTSHYFWYLDLPLLKATIRDHVYQTIYNLNLRRAHESEQGRELLDREHVIDNEADRRKHARLMNRLNKLDLALQRVANTALLMEYC